MDHRAENVVAKEESWLAGLSLYLLSTINTFCVCVLRGYKEVYRMLMPHEMKLEDVWYCKSVNLQKCMKYVYN